MEIEKECIVCGKEFIAKREDAKYCSGSCKVKAHKNRNAEPTKQATEPTQEQNQSIQDAIDQTSDNRSRIKDLEKQQEAFKAEVFKTVRDMYNKLVFDSVYKIEMENIKKSIRELQKAVNELKNNNSKDNQDKKQLNNIEDSIRQNKLHIEDLEHKLKQQPESPKTDFNGMAAKVIENISGNDAVMNKLAGK